MEEGRKERYGNFDCAFNETLMKPSTGCSLNIVSFLRCILDSVSLMCMYCPYAAFSSFFLMPNITARCQISQ